MQLQLQIKGLSKRFGGIVAVSEFSIEVEKRSIVSIIGPNGAGKTTLFNLITGFYTPDQGSILLEEIELSGVPPHRITKSGVARTFQNIRLFPWMTVRDNVIVARQVKCDSGLFSACFRTSLMKHEERATLAKVEELLCFLQLQNKANYQAKNLSYGEQRKLEIARALATEPSVLLLDEPTAGMSPSESEDCVQRVFDINQDLGVTIVLIEHNMNVVMGISERIAVLDYGIKIAEGTPEEIQNNERVVKAYLGEEYRGYT